MKQSTAHRRTQKQRSYASRPGLLALLAACGFGLLTSAAPAAPRKVRVPDPAAAQELLSRGGKLIADYEGFQLIEVAESTAVLQPTRRPTVELPGDTIELQSVRIDTRSAEARMMRKKRGSFVGRQLHLIQFAGPILPEWRERLERCGVKVINYVPQNAYLVQGDAPALAKLQEWAEVTSAVQWDGDFASAYKIHPGARVRNEFGQAQKLDTDLFAIQLVVDEYENASTLALLARAQLESVKRDFRVLQFRNLIVRLPPEVLSEIAAQPDVISIQPYLSPEKQDERQAQIMAGQLAGTSLIGPGYLDWLAQKGFSQAQFDASGFVVDVTDSGIDNGTTTPGHFGLYTHGNPALASRVAYNRIEGTAHSGGTTTGCDGHGNLNAHILAGYSDRTGGFPHTDSAGFRYGLGVCPFVRVGASVVFDPFQFTYPNYADLQSRAYADGARISANSWGMTNNTYTVDAQAFDALVRDAQPDGAAVSAPGNQEMVIVFAAGNRGSTAHTVGAPGTAKNVITVGASENVRSLNTASGGKSAMGNDGCGYSDVSADAATDLATFSSRGPCSDGRQKPDLVAPGSHIVGGAPQSAPSLEGLGNALSCFTASSLCVQSGGGVMGSTNNFFPLGQQFYTVSSGTSHAAPAVAGACALLRQYFLNQGWNAPSPAMTKAFLMNSTRFLTGAGANDNLWSPGQGMGAVNLGRALDGVSRILRDQREADTFTASGQSRVFTGRIVATNEPVRVTVAWTDAPGSTTGNAFNNDLDLIVEVGGSTYLGNRFSGAYSIPGGSADARNNVESVLLPTGTSGDLVITILAANINSDGVPNYGGGLDQDFALVVYNATNTTVPRIASAGSSIVAEGFFPTNNAIDPGEMVVVQLALRNTGTATATNLQVSLLNAGGINSASGPQSYGDLVNDGQSVSRSFTFTAASGVCGSAITAQFQLQDDTGDLGMLTLEWPLGLQTVETSHFTNNTALTIPDSGPASVYPSAINVSGLSGVVQKVTATLRGFSHEWPDDVDVLLVGPGGQKVLLMSDCGGGNARNGITVTFDSAAANSVPDSGAISSGTYRPTNYDATTDNFVVPAPGAPYGTSLATFNNTNPNGAWSLYIQDDGAIDSGSLTQGWVLSLTTSNLACVSGVDNRASLNLTMHTATNPVFTGSNFRLTISVTNEGPDAAGFVSVTNVLPVAFVVDGFSATVGSVVTNGNVVVWSLGNLAAGAMSTLTIEGRFLLAGNFSFNATAGSVTTESNLVDNVATTSVSVFKAGGPLVVGTTNTPPGLAPIADRVIHAGATLFVTNTATDAETPAALHFSFGSAPPAGATIDADSGLISWVTTDQDANTTNHFLVRVSDAGSPALTDAKSFLVAVVSRPLITNIAVTNSVVRVSWTTLPGQAYQLQRSTNLMAGEWSAVVPEVRATGALVTETNVIDATPQQFYRVLVLP